MHKFLYKLGLEKKTEAKNRHWKNTHQNVCPQLYVHSEAY